MSRLHDPWIVNGTIAPAQTSITLQIRQGNYEQVWVFEQIAVSYSISTDAPTVSILKNGILYSGAAQFLKGNPGLGQTFAGEPYLYLESSDEIDIVIQNGTAGAQVKAQCQYRIIGYDDDELKGRF
ncbi:MAG TPA: hypothetical protein VIY48_07930 [Candidatus Paceibacterota bacterium]